MKFKSVVRESHIPDEILITHPWPAVAVREQEIIVTVYREDIFRQLFHHSFIVSFSEAVPLVLEYGKKATVKLPCGTFDISLANCNACAPVISISIQRMYLYE